MQNALGLIKYYLLNIYISKNIKSFLGHSGSLGGYMKDYKLGISYENVDGHYEIYVCGIFECSCDVGELTETLEKVERSLKNP